MRHGKNSWTRVHGTSSEIDTSKQLVVFSVGTPCSNVTGYQRFGRPCCLHLQGKTLVSYHTTTRCHNPDPCVSKAVPRHETGLHHPDVKIKQFYEQLRLLNKQKERTAITGIQLSLLPVTERVQTERNVTLSTRDPSVTTPALGAENSRQNGPAGGCYCSSITYTCSTGCKLWYTTASWIVRQTEVIVMLY